MMFLPTSTGEMKKLGWKDLDVVLVTGDAYIDSPFIGVAVIGKILVDAGFRVGIIPQPDLNTGRDISRLGQPRLFWGVTAGCMDSMVANYTATGKPRRKDDLTSGGINRRRPDLAVVVYSNLIRRHFKNTCPIVIGGIEASLRRISHYDYIQNKIRRSILFDSRADILVYGMGEKTVLEISERISHRRPLNNIPGTCTIETDMPGGGYIQLPDHQMVVRNKEAFRQMFLLFLQNSDPVTARGLFQKQDTRYLVQHPPRKPLSPDELDRVYEIPFERDVHPCHRKEGSVSGIETIRFSVTTHRGCFGQCDFCGISLHQGRAVVSRSPDSIVREVQSLTRHPRFKGIIHDVGGPTANMYGMECKKMAVRGSCQDKRCLFPVVCERLTACHDRHIDLLRRLTSLPEIRRVFISSGIRHDLVIHDRKFGEKWLKNLINHHVSGQIKLAPEHCSDHILELMGKPGIKVFQAFKEKYDRINRLSGKKQFLSCYFIAAYPGCSLEDMQAARKFAQKVLKFYPEQVQIFTPTPSTPATAMYYTQTDLNGKNLFVEKRTAGKQAQKNALIRKASKKPLKPFSCNRSPCLRREHKNH